MAFDSKYTKQVVNDIFEWDVVNWSSALPLWAKALESKEKSGQAIEIGGRRGGLSLFAALEGYDVSCTDLESSESSAKPLHESHGIATKVDYRALNATDWNELEKYDVILFKSVLGGIGRDDNKAAQLQAIQNMKQALKPGGLLLFAENLDGSKGHQFFRRRFTKWGAYWRYMSYSEIEECLGDGELELRRFGFLGAFGRNEWQRRLLGKVDRMVFSRVVPEGWKYGVAGSYRKPKNND
ncbi:class I SAM-dependent methyltransferase [Sanyastnella coralliicola]|uniref:class I SAM-dependent methyltransferase n=1 Tax=Sanyastnella coralliicola TaxID=3069118 RepID=UPI0027B8D155|nr:class I SAM-dependent methyltransferase [Longitalea sp. SCSIO 12813]